MKVPSFEVFPSLAQSYAEFLDADSISSWLGGQLCQNILSWFRRTLQGHLELAWD